MFIVIYAYFPFNSCRAYQINILYIINMLPYFANIVSAYAN